ncbi:hypothetical protein J31TS4_20040 [Paenibacillus sp. J31TS4]|nr:hypothetical protein J31TS4_20040 [Paenibacillus sp. J31TS4]
MTLKYELHLDQKAKRLSFLRGPFCIAEPDKDLSGEEDPHSTRNEVESRHV